MEESFLSAVFLMWDLQRWLQTDSLPNDETALRFTFKELIQYKTWWLVIQDDERLAGIVSF